jgi:hypothetical protein
MDRAKEITAFATPTGLFGLKGTSATYQRLINKVIDTLKDCDSFQDDTILGDDTFAEHLAGMRASFDRCTEAHLTINLVKSKFIRAQVTYLGHELGHGHVKPIQAKVHAMVEYPPPKDKKLLM